MNYKEEILSDVFTKHLFDFEGKVEPFHLVVHNFTDIDKGDPHDHPFSFTSHVLKGGYVERIYVPLKDGTWVTGIEHRKPGTSHKVDARCIHQIIELPTGECWTAILPEVKVQEPGFWQFRKEGIYQRRWNEQNWTKHDLN